MVRDPTSAHAYWDISVARTERAFASLGGGKAILRLLAVPSGLLLAEQEVSAEHGSCTVALPEADRSYAAELVISHHYTKVLLARSNPIQAPPSSPRPDAAPAIVAREEQQRALELGLTLESRGAGTSTLPPLKTGGAPIAQGSEARLSASGSEEHLAK
jgi:hypothetical protein